MKRSFSLVFIGLFAGILSVTAQETKSVYRTGTGIGFHLNQYQNDFGMGLNINSPYFWHKRMAIRLRTNLMYLEHLSNEETIWSPYFSTSLGIIGIGGNIGKIRLYGEGGILLLFPNNAFSSENFLLRSYGNFGFEFFMSKGCNYFIELGGVGGGVAELIENKPLYGNGFLISVGTRISLNRRTQKEVGEK